MVDAAAVREFAIAEGLGDHVAQIVEAVRPGWVLEPDIAGKVSVPGVSKIGGEPDLAERESWPVNASGTALTFLAQIDCSSLPELPGLWPDPDPWRHRGTLLRLFADLVEMPCELCAAVAMTTDPSARVGRVGRPPRARGQPGENQDARLPECVVVAQPFLSVPEVLPGLRGVGRALLDPRRCPADARDGRRGRRRRANVGDRARSGAGSARGLAHAAGAPLGRPHRPSDWGRWRATRSSLVPVSDLSANRLDRLVCDVSSS
jgi:hypothetical protein